MTLHAVYRPSLSLLTDLYQLTMAFAYWKCGISRREAAFHLFFRSNPFSGGYAVAAGLAEAVEFLDRFHFDADDLAYLAGLQGNDGRPLFERAFLDELAGMSLCCDVDAMPEGTVAFPNEPLVRVIGPILQAQLLETPLLNLINFPTLVATKAARVVQAAEGDPVLEFGLRRAQGIDGGLTAARAGYLGGCVGTSNVLAGQVYGIPVKGTHAHSWVMCFDDEPSALRAYAEAMPNNCILLVDTYDTLQGVRHAVAVGRQLRQRGFDLAGIRLDSGDLAVLSIDARKILDEAGFSDTKIVASSDLDEYAIAALKRQGARIDVWGVGTRLATAHDDPALTGVYKLSAVRGGSSEPWSYRIKLSEGQVKTSTPGVLQVRRYMAEGMAVGDVIYDVEHPPGEEAMIIDPADATHRMTLPAGATSEDLLVPVFREGRRVLDVPSLDHARRRARRQLELLHAHIKRFESPEAYPAGLEPGLHERKAQLMREATAVQCQTRGPGQR
ncbi:MAG: nicotinate phosphoribosyltransferase [Thermoguttaceae bacterium]|jgi:nicotinate phosphoribosyltransferase|nr:nicotinate phosphoribosyltransferase [Thermoguttaceae bacterium]